MFELFIKRENRILDILQKFIDQELAFIVVGGYAVSSYKHRFSVDADIIIRINDKEKFEEVLRNNKFIKTVVKDLDHVYAPEFIRYETQDKLPVSVDLLINGIGSRNTNASFSFEQLEKYSKKRKIIGIEKEITCLIPDKEILIALKIHSGRLTDMRDIMALSKDIDADVIERFLWIGNTSIVKENIKKILTLINDKGFIDSFKGVFIEKKYDISLKDIEKLKKLI